MSVRILVVDDEEDYRVIMGDILRHEGYEVRAADDGMAALKELESWTPDVILVDWMMPRMAGDEFCRKVRAEERWRRLPIIMLTVKRSADEELEALHFGVDDFVVKPFRRDELLARIRAVLRRGKGGAAPA